ncbi:MAG: hypothetical protein QOJ99_241 [Bryobacterales bacterium]|jgi:hypothetical protein|nr:hypothetical protein [Bryobacterales bacterium]
MKDQTSIRSKTALLGCAALLLLPPMSSMRGAAGSADRIRSRRSSPEPFRSAIFAVWLSELRTGSGPDHYVTRRCRLGVYSLIYIFQRYVHRACDQ